MTPTVHYHIELSSEEYGEGPSMTCITSHDDALSFGQSYIENMTSHYNACGRSSPEDTRAEWVVQEVDDRTTVFRVDYPGGNGWDQAIVKTCKEPMIDIRDKEAVEKLMAEMFLEGKVPQTIIRAA